MTHKGAGRSTSRHNGGQLGEKPLYMTSILYLMVFCIKNLNNGLRAVRIITIQNDLYGSLPTLVRPSYLNLQRPMAARVITIVDI